MKQLKPGMRCLIVCRFKDHAFSGHEAVVTRFLGKPDDRPIWGKPDWWGIKVATSWAPEHEWAARAAWLIPLDGDPDRAERERKEVSA